MFSKRVLHLFSSWTAGGAEKLMLSLAQGLEKEGLQNYIAAPKKSYLIEYAKKMNLKNFSIMIKGSFDPIGILKLWWIVQKENIDIIHAHQGKVFWPCIIMKFLRKSKTKVVFHRHAHIPHMFYTRTHYLLADKVIAISSIVAKDLQERENVPREKIQVVYNGTDFERFNSKVSASEVRKKYGLEGKDVIGTIGQMNKPKGKGQQYLIEAAAMLKNKLSNNRYLIVGTGPILEDLKKMAQKLGVSDIVFFPGYQEEIEKYIAAMDIFCFLSWDKEGFGQVMVEAQGMGKPVIGTDIGGIPETFQNGITGILIPSENPEILAMSIQQLLLNKPKLKQMGEEAARFVNEKFSINNMIKNVINVYRELYVLL
ncbi:MAG: glycosyltransferase family 4 protein [Elusimicrobia bacterium]|nr:glycosyltransferase family 4 protein [Elusimicrobiota bacterium]